MRRRDATFHSIQIIIVMHSREFLHIVCIRHEKCSVWNFITILTHWKENSNERISGKKACAPSLMTSKRTNPFSEISTVSLKSWSSFCNYLSYSADSRWSWNRYNVTGKVRWTETKQKFRLLRRPTRAAKPQWPVETHLIVLNIIWSPRSFIFDSG